MNAQCNNDRIMDDFILSSSLHFLFPSFSFFLPVCVCVCVCLSLSLSLSLTHTHSLSHTHTLSLTHTHSLSPSLSCSKVHLMVESTAAAMAYGLLVVGTKNVLIFDMGGGILPQLCILSALHFFSLSCCIVTHPSHLL